MFETAEVGHRASKEEFAKAELELRAKLLAAQRRLRESDFSVIVIVSGVEAAGKSEVVNRLHEWLDARGVVTSVFWDESDEERERPRFWRFWRRLPAKGTVGVLFGSWYTQPIVERAFRRLKRAPFEAEMARIAEHERMLTDGGTLIVKLWFHLSKKAQKERLRALRAGASRALTPWEKRFSRLYDRFAKISDEALRATDVGDAPWRVIEAEDPRYRDLSAGRVLLEALEARLKGRAARPALQASPAPGGGHVTVLSRVDTKATMTDAKYERRFAKARARLDALGWRAREARRSTVVVFEGWDAAGKGGAIRRVTASLDARLYRVIPIAAPTDEERAQHYLWRFWRQLPRAGNVTIYDRSWYGRVLVERVEGFAKPGEWRRAYQEINAFERHLTDFGIVVAKFWLHITPAEQLRRFRERQRIAYKRHKITEEDWRNREKWDAYEEAVDEMVARCSTAHAPWTLVPANDKRVARMTVLETLCSRLEDALG